MSIFGVAAFIFCFSMLFRQTQFIAMFCAITASVFIGGAGSVIIGGLYWKRGSTVAAWTAMIVGMCISAFGLVVKQIPIDHLMLIDAAWFQSMARALQQNITGQEYTFIAIVGAVGSYVFVSLFGPRHTHDMDHLLHRGKYATHDPAAIPVQDKRSWLERLGIDPEFNGWDRIVTFISVGWPLAWILVLVTTVVWHLVRQAQGRPINDESWIDFWHVFTWFLFFSAAAVTLWFTIGGIRDLRYLVHRLSTGEADETDDGRVTTDDNNTVE
jgi:SSS family solute:Na+ symporter